MILNTRGQAIEKMVSDISRGLVEDNLATTPKVLQDLVKRDFVEQVSYQTAWRAMERILEKSSEEDEYGFVKGYLQNIKSDVPGSISELKENKGKLQRLFNTWCLF